MAFRTMYEQPTPTYGSSTYAIPRPQTTAQAGVRSGAQVPGTAQYASPSLTPKMGAPAWTRPGKVEASSYETLLSEQTKQLQESSPKISTFLWNVLGNVKNMDVDTRAEYLENVTTGIKDKLDRYTLRLARGVPLTAEQQKRYDSLQSAFNDIQRYVGDQSNYDQYLLTVGDRTPEEYVKEEARKRTDAIIHPKPWYYG
ncbi:MAG: hypothetical protein PHW65_00040 [Dehalococcoidales bacterium]|nr:hypothetical protein [Dehalococcoidales bacterium]